MDWSKVVQIEKRIKEISVNPFEELRENRVDDYKLG
jgi:hypothetical protein